MQYKEGMDVQNVPRRQTLWRRVDWMLVNIRYVCASRAINVCIANIYSVRCTITSTLYTCTSHVLSNGERASLANLKLTNGILLTGFIIFSPSKVS